MRLRISVGSSPEVVHTAETKQSRDPTREELKCAFPGREAERA